MTVNLNKKAKESRFKPLNKVLRGMADEEMVMIHKTIDEKETCSSDDEINLFDFVAKWNLLTNRSDAGKNPSNNDKEILDEKD